MTDPLSLALQIAVIGLPVMIGIICVFVLLAKLLVVLFPHEQAKAAKSGAEIPGQIPKGSNVTIVRPSDTSM